MAEGKVLCPQGIFSCASEQEGVTAPVTDDIPGSELTPAFQALFPLNLLPPEPARAVLGGKGEEIKCDFCVDLKAVSFI